MSTNNFQINLSLLRITATISVIWLHVSSTLIQNPDLFPMSDTQMCFYNAVYQMMCWAVPVFYMITGALLLEPSKNITIDNCLKKYVFRVAMAIVVFGIPFSLLKLIMETGKIDLSLIPLTIKAMLENQGLSHMWYLYSLIGLYLSLPVLRVFVKNAGRNEVKLVLISLFLLDFIIPSVNNLCGLKIAFHIPLQYPIFYSLIGYYININKEITQKYKNQSILFASGLTVLIWATNYAGINKEKLTLYDSVLAAVLSVSIFALFCNLNMNLDEKQKRVLWKTDRLCFGVYLIHPVFIQFTYRYLKITPLNTESYIFFTFLFAMIFTVLSFTGSWVLSKIKPLRKYVL